MNLQTLVNSYFEKYKPISCGSQTWRRSSFLTISFFKIFSLALPNKSKRDKLLLNTIVYLLTHSSARIYENNDVPLNDLTRSWSSLWASWKCKNNLRSKPKSTLHIGHKNPSKTTSSSTTSAMMNDEEIRNPYRTNILF